jgi:hypothetical protein
VHPDFKVTWNQGQSDTTERHLRGRTQPSNCKPEQGSDCGCQTREMMVIITAKAGPESPVMDFPDLGVRAPFESTPTGGS